MQINVIAMLTFRWSCPVCFYPSPHVALINSFR